MTGSLKYYKSRYLVAVWLVTWFYVPAHLVMEFFESPPEWYWWDIAYYLTAQILIGIVLLLVGMSVRLNTREFFGAVPDANAVKDLALLFGLLWALTGALNYLVYYPLSFIAPEFVTWWFIEIPPAVYLEGGAFPLLPNVLSFISLVVFTPVIEEVLFRGYLLQRWAHKWGLLRGVAFSSILFGIGHPDMLPATIFGVAMCIVYLRSGSLIGPILFHAAWNLLSWSWELYDIQAYGEYYYTLEEFQSGWAWGLFWTILSMVFLAIYTSRKRARYVWRLPDV